jgi:diphosphomevalonate decarboxylase
MDKDLSGFETDIKSGKIGFSSPSNIALVKYWGKYGDQYPQNPSISFTLDYSRTEMILEFSPKRRNTAHRPVDLTFTFEGRENKSFEDKIIAFFTRLLPTNPFLGQFSFNLKSANTFPHSAGIASSASSMSALALCIVTLENQLFQNLTDKELLRKASYLSRLASGSACRSVFPKIASWGATPSISESSNEHATPLAEILHPVYHTFKDAILLVSNKEKDVSSRAGHKLMEQNPYASVRYEQAKNQLNQILEALKTGDLDKFIPIVELEAMTLHALMMCSSPYFLLLQPNTISLIKKIKNFRAYTKIPLCFTLDAGPNIHLLYPGTFENEVLDFIHNELSSFCEQGKWIADQLGNGPVLIS